MPVTVTPPSFSASQLSINHNKNELNTGSTPGTVVGAGDTGGKKTESLGGHVVAGRKTVNRTVNQYTVLPG